MPINDNTNDAIIQRLRSNRGLAALEAQLEASASPLALRGNLIVGLIIGSIFTAGGGFVLLGALASLTGVLSTPNSVATDLGIAGIGLAVSAAGIAGLHQVKRQRAAYKVRGLI